MQHGAVDLVAVTHRPGEQAARDPGIGEVAPVAQRRRELGNGGDPVVDVTESKIGEAPNTVLRDASNDTGILPYARSVVSNGAVCAKWSGRLTVARVANLLAACARIISPPVISPPGHSRS
jgi:hypothetical protein